MAVPDLEALLLSQALRSLSAQGRGPALISIADLPDNAAFVVESMSFSTKLGRLHHFGSVFGISGHASEHNLTL